MNCVELHPVRGRTRHQTHHRDEIEFSEQRHAEDLLAKLCLLIRRFESDAYKLR